MLSDLLSRHNIKVKFILVGIWNTIFGYLVFCGLDTLFEHLFSPRYVAYMSAMVVGQVISVINAYIFHKYVTFKSEAKGVEIVKEFLRFSATYAFTFGLSLLMMPFFVEGFDIKPKIAAAIIILICTVVSYLGHSRFSFRHKK